MIRRLLRRGSAAGVVVAAAMTLLLPQSASALTYYSEGFETGGVTWVRTLAQSVDCTRAHTGYCSQKHAPTSFGTYEEATAAVVVPFTARYTTVEFWFYNSSTGGNWDSAVKVYLNDGSFAEYITTEGINNGVSVLSSTGSGHRSFGSWSAGTWNRATLVFDDLTNTVSASLNGGPTTSISFSSGATGISTLGNYVVGWNSYGSSIWYDDFSVSA